MLLVTGHRQPGLQPPSRTFTRVGRISTIGPVLGGRCCDSPGWRSRGRSGGPSPLPATPGGNPGAEGPAAEEDVQDNVPPLQSWADVVPDPSSTFDWAPPPPPRPPPKHPLANAAFALTLGGIAVGAFFVGRQYHAYNKAREAAHMTMGPQAAAMVETPAAAIRHHREEVKRHELEEEHRAAEALSSASETEESSMLAPSAPPLPLPEDQDGKKSMQFAADEDLKSTGHVAGHAETAEEPVVASKEDEATPSAPPAPASATAEKTNESSATVSLAETQHSEPESTFKAAPESPPPARATTTTAPAAPTGEKLPLRSPEATAALARIRALQERRNQLYDRAIARQESKDEHEGAQPAAPATAPPVATVGPAIQTQGHQEASSQTDAVAYDAWVISEAARQASEEAAAGAAAPPAIPPGMTLNALKDRATAANKAAAAAAASAHRAASASAMAADAADRAAQLAARAAAAAERCQGALDLRRADAIEAAYKKAAEAEEVADAAVRAAAVGAAKSVMGESDAGRHAAAAEAAADLSRPRGVVAQASAAWRQARRGAADAVQRGGEGAAAVAAGAKEAWAQAGSRVHDAGEAAVNGVKGAWAAVQQRIKGGGTGPAAE